MTSFRNPLPSDLEDAFYELSLERDPLDADVLDRFVGRFPEFELELHERAIDLAFDSLHDEALESTKPELELDPASMSPAVSRALSRYQNALHALGRTGQPNARSKSPAGKVSSAFNPLRQLSRDEFRAFAVRLGANIPFAAKLRDRQIAPETMTEGFQRRVAAELDVPAAVVASHFAAEQPRISAGRQYYKAHVKPVASGRQSFADAVKSSGLTDSQQGKLMNL